MDEWFGVWPDTYDEMKEFLVDDTIETDLEMFDQRVDAAVTDLIDDLTDTLKKEHPKGWECPKCGRCYAPTVKRCWVCRKVTLPLTMPDTWLKWVEDPAYEGTSPPSTWLFGSVC